MEMLQIECQHIENTSIQGPALKGNEKTYFYHFTQLSSLTENVAALSAGYSYGGSICIILPSDKTRIA